MEPLKLDLWTFDVAVAAATPQEYADAMVTRVLDSWSAGADVVCFPEYTWMGLERFVDTPDKARAVAHLFWQDLWPDISRRLSHPHKAVIAGTAPFSHPDGSLTNRAPILSESRTLHQDKIHLTPWESTFTGGAPVHVWQFRNRTLAVVICLDIEIPEIAAALRGSAVDLILVPSATESLHGVSRVGRCASARAVELGCHVAVCHLVGKIESEWIDENLGTVSHYTPAQSTFAHHFPQPTPPIYQDGFHRLSIELSMEAIDRTRLLRGETDPSKVTPFPISIIPF